MGTLELRCLVVVMRSSVLAMLRLWLARVEWLAEMSTSLLVIHRLAAVLVRCHWSPAPQSCPVGLCMCPARQLMRFVAQLSRGNWQ